MFPRLSHLSLGFLGSFLRGEDPAAPGRREDGLAGPATRHQPSLSCLPAGEEGRAEEQQRTGQLGIWPCGLCFLPSPINGSTPIPPALPSSSSSNPKDRWGPVERNVTTVKALSSGSRVRGSQLRSPRPGQSLMSSLVSARLGLERVSVRGGGAR